ncbi:TPA: hypothetical protein ACMU0H_002687 [Clostridioides difficile]
MSTQKIVFKTNFSKDMYRTSSETIRNVLWMYLSKRCKKKTVGAFI